MESDGKRLYSVLTRTEIRDKMMKEIVQISEVFSLSQSDATVTLIRLGWDSIRASDLLGDDKERFLSKLGLLHLSDTDGDGDDTLVSTPLCSHKFCSDCWKDHLSESLEKKTATISCLNQDCVVSVGPDTIEKLPEGEAKEMYERYVLESFMESNKIKWCPASGCEYAIKRHDDDDGADDGEDEDEEEASDDLGVVCLCGHTFCWKCKLESHRPVTCNNASLWLSELLEEATTLSSNPKTTKPCPRCNSNVQKLTNVDWTIVTCHCSHAFCWRCLRSEEDHREISLCAKVHVPPPSNEVALLRHLTLWEEYHKAMEASKRDLETIERHSIPLLTSRRGLGELDMRALREAYVLIVQCRLVLKWSCLFGYFLTDYNSGKKKYLDHLREVATMNLVKHKESVYEWVREAISGGDIRGFRHKMETSTTATGNYFHYFVKTVEDGMSEVKGGVFENEATDYWFCDRCTFQNDSFEQKCRVCVFPFEGPSPLKALGNNSIGTAVSSHQVPNVSSNPFAYVSFGNNSASVDQQGANPFVGLGHSDSVHQQGVANVSNNPFAGNGGTARPVAFGVSSHQQQFPNLANNPFASPGGTSYFPMSSPSVSYGNNSIGTTASAYQPNMENNPFASRRGGPIFYSPPLVSAYGYNGAHQLGQVPSMMGNNPFARPGGTYPLQSPPLVAFGNNNNGAPNMMVMNNPFAFQGGTRPHVGVGSNNSSGSGHQQQASSDMPNNPAVALVKEEPNLGNKIKDE